MSLGDTANPRIWLDADCYRAPVGTTSPTDVTTALNVAWKAFGLLGEDGASEKRDSDSEDYYAWGGKLIRVKRSKFKRTISIVALEDNPTVFGLVNPGSTAATVSGVTTRTVKNPTVDVAAYLLETVDGTVKRRRVIPRGEVTSVEDVEISDSALQAYAIEITIYPAADGTLYFDISNDPQWVVP